METIGKVLVVAGVLLVVTGTVLMMFGKVPFFGKMPGDINIKKDNFHFFFPITTSVILSVLVSAILWMFFHFKGK